MSDRPQDPSAHGDHAARLAALEAANVELEVRIAYQDKLIAELDAVVREFAGKVEAIRGDLSEARRTLEGMRETGPANDPPPHY